MQKFKKILFISTISCLAIASCTDTNKQRNQSINSQPAITQQTNVQNYDPVEDELSQIRLKNTMKYFAQLQSFKNKLSSEDCTAIAPRSGADKVGNRSLDEFKTAISEYQAHAEQCIRKLNLYVGNINGFFLGETDDALPLLVSSYSDYLQSEAGYREKWIVYLNELQEMQESGYLYLDKIDYTIGQNIISAFKSIARPATEFIINTAGVGQEQRKAFIYLSQLERDLNTSAYLANGTEFGLKEANKDFIEYMERKYHTNLSQYHEKN